jgi:HTH-type transcriptional regulator, sugar sensing transcriptional regulator
MIKIEQLTKIGLKPQPAAIYFTLLQAGSQFVQEISKNTGIKRTTLYPIIEKMIEDNLLGVEIRQKRKFYFAKDPEQLLLQLREQKNLMEALLPQMKDLFGKNSSGPKIQVYESMGGLKKTLETILTLDPRKDELLTIEADIEGAFAFGFDFWKQLLGKKKKLGIPSRSIIPSSEKENFVIRDHKIQIRANNFLNDFKIMLYLFSNKTIIILPSETLCIVIENKKIKQSLANLFDIIWKRSKPWHES